MSSTAAAIARGPFSDLSREGAAVASSFAAAVAGRKTFDVPYRHWLLEDVFPAAVTRALATLPFAAPQLDGVSGKRELHNDKRSYFDAAAMARFPVMRAVAEALQSSELVRLQHEAFGAPIDDTFLRLEYAQDVDGFWLEPHSDLGVKKFTCLIYLSDGPGHDALGTDIYWSKERHFGRSPFKPGSAMIFVPADNTWHGFEKRTIEGVRRSVILNYVTHDWRAREQLSFPETPVRVSAPPARGQAGSVRLERIRAEADRIFGDPEKASRWLRKSSPALSGKAPIDVLSTEGGAQAVSELLIQIDNGMFI